MRQHSTVPVALACLLGWCAFAPSHPPHANPPADRQAIRASSSTFRAAPNRGGLRVEIPPCAPEHAFGDGPGKPVIGGRTSPDGKVTLVCDLPASERKKNIASSGLGCCVFRSGEYAGRYQNEPEMYDLPEKMVKAHIPGGGYPEKVDKVFRQLAPHVQYVQDTTGDAGVLEAILRSGRMACVTYDGHDPHYGGSIAHMVCCPYFDRSTGWACVSDNNFTGENDFVWMSCDEFIKRWKGGGGGGWCYALLHPGPPPVPHN